MSARPAVGNPPPGPVPPPAAPAPAQPAGTAPPASGERRTARRRAAAPSRDRIAANDDAPSIGGLIYALNQRPSKKPFYIAGWISAGWAVVTLGFGALYMSNELTSGADVLTVIRRPEMLMLVATLLGPIGLFFTLAMMAWRSEEMRLRSSAMTEVAVRLAEPDRMAEQSVASLGQAVRRQVSFMNDAVARALGRAGELEALVHNEVSALERSYEENERKIRGLIQELAGERNSLVNTSERMSGSLRDLGSEVPQLIEKLSEQQLKLARIIEGAGQNLTALESAIGAQAGNLETTLDNRTQHLQSVLTEYTAALSTTLDQRMEAIGTTIASRTGDLQIAFDSIDGTLDQRMGAIGDTIAARTGDLQSVFDEYTHALDSTLATRAQQLETQLNDRTSLLDAHLTERSRALDDAFNERLRLFDEAILRSTIAVDQSVGEKTQALTTALDHHARTLGDTLSRQSIEMDENLMQGINAVRRSSETITRQSMKAIEGMASQSELLRNVSESLLGQINAVANRFENQGHQILHAAQSLESANDSIDRTLQQRHAELTGTLDRLQGAADQFGTVTQGYSRQIEGTLTEAERRARTLTAELAQNTAERSRATLAEIERMKDAASDNTTRALEDLRSRFSNVQQEVSQSLGTLSNQFTETTTDVRRRAAQAANELAAEQDRLKAQINSLPETTREGADQMRKMMQDQLRALDQLSSLTQREGAARDISRPIATPGGQQAPRSLIPVATSPATREEQTKALGTLSSALSQELQNRAARPQQQYQAQASMPQQTLPQQPAPAAGGHGGDTRENWSLGDLLKRASSDDPRSRQQQPYPPQAAPGGHPGAAAPGAGVGIGGPALAALDIAAVARALDPATAGAIWQRLGSGQTGIMVRSIYTPEGRALFDDTVRRAQTDPAFQHTAQQYLADFERVLQVAEQQDPSGRTAQGHLVSDYGRVYLFLAHATGRIA